MHRKNRVNLIKKIYNDIVKTSNRDVYDFYEPRSDGMAHKPYAFRYYENRDEFEVIESPGCQNIGIIIERGSSGYGTLMSVREHWSKFPFDGGSCTTSSEAMPMATGPRMSLEEQLSQVDHSAMLNAELMGSEPTSLTDELFPFGGISGATRNRLQSLTHADAEFANIETTAPSGGQLAEFSGGNWRYHQPNLGELKWFIENGVTDIIRLSGDGSGDMIRDPQIGVNITVDVQKRFVEGLGANFHRPSAHSGYRFGRGYTRSIQSCNSILSGGNCLVHCRWGADRTGYIVAAFLKETGTMTDLESLWEYTVGFNRWESKICRDASNLGYSKYLDGFYPLDRFCDRHSDCDVCNKLDQLR